MRTGFLLTTAVLLIWLSPQVRVPAASRQVTSITITRPSVPVEELLTEAFALVRSEKWSAALAKVDEALGLGKSSDKAAQLLSDVARALGERGFWQESVYCYRRLLDFAGLDATPRIDARLALAETYLKLSQPDDSIANYEAALAISRQADERPAQARALAGLAAAHASRGDLGKAAAYLSEIGRFEPGDRDGLTEARALRSMSLRDRQRDLPEEARRSLERSLGICRRDAYQEDEAATLAALSNLHLASGENEKALEYASLAVKLARTLPGLEARWRAFLELARAQRASGDDHNANNSFSMAFGYVEAQNVRLTADELRISLLDARQSVYREYADFLVTLGQNEEALKIAEHARARATLDLLSTGHAATEAPTTPAKRAALQDADRQIAALETRLRSDSLSNGERATVEVSLRAAEQKRSELSLEMQMTLLKRFTKPVDPAALREVLGPDEAVIEFFLGENRSHAWLVTRADLRVVDLPPRKLIEDHVRAYLTTISVRPTALHLDRELARQKQQAGELFDLVLGPLGKEMTPGRRVTIVPDGLLYYLPFESLVRNGRHLIEDYEISYAPSASILSLLRRSLTSRDDTRKDLIAFGDPIVNGAVKTVARVQHRVDPSRSDRLAPLPNTRIEVSTIANLFPAGRTKIYLGAEATEGTLKRAPLGQYRRLHLATHALVNESYPARSGVLLTSAGDDGEDGFLSLDEITRLHLDCDLVVLSACSTGRGRLVMGEGVLGITRAFLVAGARSVGVTLWNVSDLSTAELVKRFYQNIAAGQTESAALRQAKINFIRGRGQSRHPYFWASLILAGAAQ